MSEVDGGTYVRKVEKGIPAIMWSGFNLERVITWLDRWAPVVTVTSVTHEGVMALSSKPTGVPLGWWLMVENGQLGWANPQSFLASFESKS